MTDKTKAETIADGDLDLVQGGGTAVGNPGKGIFDTRPGKGIIWEDSDIDIVKSPSGKGEI